MRIELSVILQILLESLPVSSSGNLALFGISLPQTINYVSHVATVLVYAIFFRKKLFTLLLHPLRCKKVIAHAMLYGAAALVPTICIYGLLEYFNPHFYLPLGFFITTLLLLASFFAPQKVQQLTVTKAAIIGFAQGIALLPGISRLGITYVVGRFLGLSWRTAFNFSCMIEAPLIIVASLKGLYDIRADILTISFLSLVGYIVATFGAYLLLCLVYKLAQANRWWLFGIYTGFLTILACVH